jgi:hypothetical protein
LLHVPLLERLEFLGVETGRRFVDPVQGELLDQLLPREMFRLIVQRPTQQRQIIDDRLGQVTDLLVEVGDHWVEGGRTGRMSDRLGYLQAMLHELGEIAVLQVLVELAFAQLRPATRLGHKGQVRVLGQFVAQGLGDENLPRRVGKVLFRPDDVRDLQIVVIHHAGKMVKARPVRPLDHMVLFPSPVELHPAADQVVEE